MKQLSDFKKLVRTSPPELIDFFEAFILLVVVRIFVLVVPEKTLAKYIAPLLIARPAQGKTISSRQSAHNVQRTSRAVGVVACRLPGSYNCLVQAMAAQLILIRRKSPAKFCIGITSQTGLGKNDDKKVAAHAWLMWENEIVLGKVSNIESYHPLSEPTNGS